ncbi:hypothetical protein RN001_009566 [Aquatica leii]|uniref:Uncharacterized protein n=1 Tax=Aquatica leii TaxID=1421715 RepID=A0AAN7NZS1_9COLE|nr:hypothetical protein RN001_009566 [Aquatica leii]
MISILIVSLSMVWSSSCYIIPNAAIIYHHAPVPLIYHPSIYSFKSSIVKQPSALYVNSWHSLPLFHNIKPAKIETFDEEVENISPAAPKIPQNSGEDDGSYKPDNSGDYVPDNSGDYVPDDSGRYNPETTEEPNNHSSTDTVNPEEVETLNPLNPPELYSFGFSTDNQMRSESADLMGNVKGRYSFVNSAGNHDLTYVAGSATGFLPTGGSLAVPNGFLKTANIA